YIESTAALPDIESHLLDVFCSTVAICSENVCLVERLRTAAYVDDLTRLPNRVAQIEAIDRLGKVSRAQDRVLGLIDIDEFSETIDAFGYLFGDRQLQAVAARLRAALPADVHLARVGGDIFGVYGSRDVVNPASLRSILFEPFENEAGPHTISFSIGFASGAEADDRGAELLRNAAIALKRAKLDGPGNDAYYTAEVGMLTRQRVHLLHDLRAALDNAQLFVVYQPQFDLASGTICGIEALVRWRSGTGEAVPLDQFIPVAEQSGLIVDLGAWVLRMALAAQRELADHGYPLRMAVNVSPVQFRHHAFLRMVRAAVAEAAIDARLLELEITESVALFGWAQTVERMRAIKALGASIAIDDFGTGFSSLSYLARLPTDCLKIDRSFVAALGNRHSGTPIAELVVQLGKQLGMRVLAEGVENPLQLQTLRSLGCHEGQGMAFAPPMEQQDLLHWLKGREP
ncbi:MAG TPA: EAL domain-containing protein, partial [Patescibacteria group bacterium]|nr:EAL domain-containing protein [Patescibacteria group bacterium]